MERHLCLIEQHGASGPCSGPGFALPYGRDQTAGRIRQCGIIIGLFFMLITVSRSNIESDSDSHREEKRRRGKEVAPFGSFRVLQC